MNSFVHLCGPLPLQSFQLRYLFSYRNISEWHFWSSVLIPRNYYCKQWHVDTCYHFQRTWHLTGIMNRIKLTQKQMWFQWTLLGCLLLKYFVLEDLQIKPCFIRSQLGMIRHKTLCTQHAVNSDSEDMTIVSPITLVMIIQYYFCKHCSFETKHNGDSSCKTGIS